MRRTIRSAAAGFPVAKASEQFRQSDVTLWAITALVCAGLAVFGSNASLLVPQGIIAGLHQPRIAGATIESLRSEVSALRNDTMRLRTENQQMLSRFALQEKSGSDVLRRVGALEVTVPTMLEGVPVARLVDSASTASIGEGQAVTFEAEGGSVSVRQSPLVGANPVPPLPAPISPQTATALPSPTSYGVAIGAPVSFEQAPAQWNDLTLKVGPLLFGLAPLLMHDDSSTDKRIVVGPIAELSEARSLCERFERISIACLPMPYDGTPLSVDR